MLYASYGYAGTQAAVADRRYSEHSEWNKSRSFNLQEMATHDTEICGFLDVKLTSNKHIKSGKVRKKVLVLSRVWKRFWCTARRMRPDPVVQIQFNTTFGRSAPERSNSVVIPSHAVVHRTRSKTKPFAFCVSPAADKKPLLTLSATSETETQRWMAGIRHLLRPRRHHCAEKCYNVSIVDNVHSKTADLTGLYGDLIVNENGLCIKNVYTGETTAAFEWKEFSQFHLITIGRPEDVKRICVIHTTKDFRCGVGELYLFCLDADKLLLDLVTQGRGPKYKLKSLDFNEENHEVLTQHKVSNPPAQLKSNVPFQSCNTEANCHEESNISIASGVYEEILDNVCPSESRTYVSDEYENVNDAILFNNNLQIEPPPLPPRHNRKSEYTMEDRVNPRECCNRKISTLGTSLQTTEDCTQATLTGNSNYIPMSLQEKDFLCKSLSVADNSEENEYVIMQ